MTLFLFLIGQVGRPVFTWRPVRHVSTLYSVNVMICFMAVVFLGVISMCYAPCSGTLAAHLPRFCSPNRCDISVRSPGDRVKSSFWREYHGRYCIGDIAGTGIMKAIESEVLVDGSYV
ncbi:hypothetical protein BR93DRAFT_94010 [Coniochaeta sp. PMI_546]|nr:hypothetical protein BR93DRAFT_94010 [Coniochaeta sp. PMI_546]